MPKKLKACSSNWNIKNFKHQSQNEIYWFKMIKCYDVYGAKWKASKLSYQVLWKVIYAYFYNWDWSLFLVLIVYVLVELIIEAHIRLKTISFLIPTHITHAYVQWMPYSFVWLYLIKCVALTQSHVDQTQKRFLSVLIVFGKCFVSKIFKNFKNCATLFWQLYLTGQASREPLVTSLCRSSWQLSSRSRPQSWKRLRKLSKFWVFSIFATQFGDLFASGSSSRKSYSEWFVTPVTTYSQVDLPIEKNT